MMKAELHNTSKDTKNILLKHEREDFNNEQRNKKRSSEVVQQKSGLWIFNGAG